MEKDSPIFQRPDKFREDGEYLRIEESYLTEVPTFEEAAEAKAPGVKALYFDGPRFRGKPSKVFAFYGAPPVRSGEKVPAVVLVHGGGGTAFAEWVNLWVSRGYAAIAVDTLGHVPLSHGGLTPVPGGGITVGPDFHHLEAPLEDQWPYYAENAIARARTLLGSFPEVDAKRIGITGISWGGYLSCMAAALDGRYAFAVHVYGCGFLKESSAWRDELNEPGKESWSRRFDPSLFLARTRPPVLWISGTNDTHYPIESLIKSYSLVQHAPVILRITVDMPHGHPDGWSPPEIRYFADSLCLGGSPLPKISACETDGSQAWAFYDHSVPIKSGTLIYSKHSDANWKERRWESVSASLCGSTGKISAHIPLTTAFYFFNIRTDSDLVVSSPVVVRDTAQDSVDRF